MRRCRRQDRLFSFPWPYWITAVLWLVWTSGAGAMTRVTWLQQGEAAGVGTIIEAGVESELKRRGIVLTAPSSIESDQDERFSAREVRRIGFENEADAVVIGRAEDSAESDEVEYSLAVYSAQSGVRLGLRTASISARDLGPVEVRVWASWVAQTLALPARDSVPNKTRRDRPVAASNAGGLDNLLRFRGPDRGSPLQIEAESLVVLGLDDRTRRIRFTGNVRVELGEMILLANQLEAFYQAGDSEPERLIAKGKVRIDQGDRRALCQTAEYSRKEDQVTCSGEAVLFHGCDTVRGDRIELELGRDRARVKGAASVVIVPTDSELSCMKDDS